MWTILLYRHYSPFHEQGYIMTQVFFLILRTRIIAETSQEKCEGALRRNDG